MKSKYKFYEVDIFNGNIKVDYATSKLDLDITLANGDCFNSHSKAVEFSNKIKALRKDDEINLERYIDNRGYKNE